MASGLEAEDLAYDPGILEISRVGRPGAWRNRSDRCELGFDRLDATFPCPSDACGLECQKKRAVASGEHPTKAKILALVRSADGPVSYMTLSKALAKDYKVVWRHCVNLIERGLLRGDSKGVRP